MSGGSWYVFADLLAEENRCLGELGAAALTMTRTLVFGTAAELDMIDRDVEAKRLLLAQAHLRRSMMMKSGFGDLTLRQVCRHAPRPLRGAVYRSFREMRVRGISLRITIENNKTLISAGLARIAKSILVMQQGLTERTGTYRRRGSLTPPNGSLIVSRKA